MLQNRTRLGGERRVSPARLGRRDQCPEQQTLPGPNERRCLFNLLSNPDSHDADQLLLASFSQLHKVEKQFGAFGFAKP